MRRNNRLGKRNNEISLYEYNGMNILVGAIVQRGVVRGAVVGGGGGELSLGNCPKGVIFWGYLSGGQSSGGSCPGGNCLGAAVQEVMIPEVIVLGDYCLEGQWFRGKFAGGSCPGGICRGGGGNYPRLQLQRWMVMIRSAREWSNSWPSSCEFDPWLRRTFFRHIFASHICRSMWEK